MLRAEGLTKRYVRRGKDVLALDGVDVEIGKGQFVAITGPSGSGKSTLLLTLAGLIRPTAGTVHVNGQAIYELSSEARAALRRKTVGFVFQTFNLVPYLTALQNVQVPLYLNRVAPRVQRERAAHLLAEVGLSDRLDHKPSELSIGQQQRVALARTLANEPQIIFADEPTGNLDPALADEMLHQLVELNDASGVTVVMVTHDPRMAVRATRLLLLADGRLST